jgi:hypothetical protein
MNNARARRDDASSCKSMVREQVESVRIVVIERRPFIDDVRVNQIAKPLALPQ